MQTVLVTGGCGFIGRYVVDELLSKGHKVKVLDGLIEQVHGGVMPELDPRVEFIKAEMTDAQAVAQALDGVESVIHLAAEVGVGQSMYEIARYVSANDLGTAVLLEKMIGKPIKRIIVASSMSVYGEGYYQSPDGKLHGAVRRQPERVKAGHWNPQTAEGANLTPVATSEDKPVDLASIYALTKFAQEREVLIFGQAYNVEAIALRLFNVFGPGQALSNPYTGVLANFASRLANNQPPMIFEDGQQRRDFVHVRDVARAFRLALEAPKANGHVINVGSGNAYTIEEVATLLAQAMGVPELKPDILNKTRSGDIRNCFADITAARELLGFEPQYRLQDTLAELADWVSVTGAVDRGAQMKKELEERGLVS